LQAVAPNGDKVVQVLTFHRGTYVIDVAYDVTNAGGAPISPYAYFQFTRDTKTQGVQNSMAPVSYAGPVIYNETDKFKKIDFARSTSTRRTLRGSFRTRRTPTTAGSEWSSTISSPRGSPAMTGSCRREYYARKLDGGLYAAGMVVPVGTIAPGATAQVTVPLYVGPQEQDTLAKLAKGSISSSITAFSR
jgi:YidC/Oxa1 family membrane protein insertase